MIPYLILTGALTGSAGWWIGHRTARVRIVVIGATAQQDATAIDQLSPADEQQLAEWRARLDQLTAPFNTPDQEQQ